eukprot:Nk52_evm1s862 gene=Nk52_evmTU1s862
MHNSKLDYPLVIDGFAGTGTTSAVCKVNGWSSLAIEKEPSFIPYIHNRLVSIDYESKHCFAADDRSIKHIPDKMNEDPQIDCEEYRERILAELAKYPELTTIKSHGVPRESNLPQFQLRLKPDANLPARQKPYRVSAKENEFIEKEFQRYVEGGLAVSNMNPKLVSPVFCVPKPHTDML